MARQVPDIAEQMAQPLWSLTLEGGHGVATPLPCGRSRPQGRAMSPGRRQKPRRRGLYGGRPVTYRSYPPASGMHYPRTLQPGVYDQEISPGYWVHNLEHGYVVVQYRRPQGCPELVDEVRRFYEDAPPSKYGHRKLVILTLLTDGEPDHHPGVGMAP